MRSRAATIFSVVLCIIATGCATVRSYPSQTYQVQKGSAGFTYFLPLRMMKMTATRTPIDEDKLLRDRAQKEGELVQARTARNEAKGRRERASALLAALDQTASAGTRTQMQQTIETAAAEERLAQTAVTNVETALTNINAALITIRAGGVACSYSAKLELLPAQADPDYRFIAQMAHSPLRDDTMTLKVTPAGLLSSTNVIAVDRTGDIIVEIAGAISGLGGSGGIRTLVQGSTGATDCGEPRQFVQILDPLREWPGTNPEHANPDDFTLPAIAELNTALSNADFPFRIIPDMRALVVRGNNGLRSRLAGEPHYRRYEGAIYYRSPVPVTFSIEQKRANDRWQPIDAAIVMLPQAGPVTYIPMESAAFVRTVNDVQFVDGSIASWNSEHPSEVLEFVRLPVRVLTAIVSVPAQLISLRVNLDTRERELAESQRLEMRTAERMRLLRECIERSESQGTSSLSCFD